MKRINQEVVLNTSLRSFVYVAQDDENYKNFVKQLQANFNTNAIKHGSKLFTSNVTGIFGTYLKNIPAEYRQHYNCRECKKFIEKYGTLVFVDGKTGVAIPAIWSFVPKSKMTSFFDRVMNECDSLFLFAKVTGAFLTDEKVWGNPQTGFWDHIHLKPHSSFIHISKISTSEQAAAEKLEDFNMLNRVLSMYTDTVIGVVVDLLKTGGLYRAEKVVENAEWLGDVKAALSKCKGITSKLNLLWRVVMYAPPGFCHIGSSMLGTLLGDVKLGIPIDDIKAKFNKKMDPTKYQRPQAAPKAGTVMQAEKIIEKLKAAGSLERRYARISELPLLWKPSIIRKPQTPGVFGELLTPHKVSSGKPAQTDKVTTITFTKFAKTILPMATKVELFVAPGPTSFAGILTAMRPAAPPIIQWDSISQRNPFSWYMFAEGSTGAQWGLVSYKFHEVTGICTIPSMWNEGYPQFGNGAVFIIKNAKPQVLPGLCLFPEMLKSEFHGIRSVIEAYSKTKTPTGAKMASACGLLLSGEGTGWKNTFKVTTKSGVISTHNIDRWD